MDAAGRPLGEGGRSGRSFEMLSLGSFVILGVPDGMLGTAWPSMRQSFGVPVGDLGLILLATTAGSAGITVFVAGLIRRFGVPAVLALAGCCSALAALGIALAPGLWLVLSVAVLLGVAAGIMDGGLNTAIGLSGRRRLLNLLHGAYGVGTAVGPLVVTAALLSGSWRPAYVVLVVFDLVIATSWLLHRRHRPQDRKPSLAGEQESDATDPATDPVAHPSDDWRRRRSASVVVAGMVVFFVYTGLEVSAGQWEASFGRGHLGLSASEAGLATFGYWGSLTAVRIALALIRRPVRPSLVVRVGTLLAVLAAGIIWWEPDPAVALTGFVVLGAALAGVFPAMISMTSMRIGERRARHVISWQVGASAVGGSGISALVGLLIGAAGLGVLGPCLTVLAVIVVGGDLVVRRYAPLRSPAPEG